MKFLALFLSFCLVFSSCSSMRRVAVDHSGDDPINIGYGTTTKDDSNNAIATIKVDQRSTDIYSFIQGKVAGVTVVGNKFRVRGTRTVSGDGYALVLVDGIEVSDLTGITPDMVDTVDVLKDAASSSIYGVRGANGVILVNLRKK